jgi:probable F420-dependent oxidoreductase
LLEWVSFAEDRGFGMAIMSDHVAPTPEVEATYPAPFFDPFTTLAWLAGQTRSLLLGTSITVLPYRHPLLTARMSATIDRLSGGRFVLGVGVGWATSEYDALDLPFADRGALTSEYLEVITKFWDGDTATFHGRTVSFDDVSTAPAPAAGHLQVWVGGTSRPAIRRAATYAQAWHPNGAEVSWLRTTGLPALAAAAAAQGRSAPDLAPRIRLHLGDGVSSPDRPIGVGSLEQVLGDIRELQDLGATYVVLDTNPDEPVAREFDRERDALQSVIEAYQA